MQRTKKLSIAELKASASISIINQNLDAIKGGLQAAGCHLTLINNVLIDDCTGKPMDPATWNQ